MDSVFIQIGIVTILAAGLGLLTRVFRQPLVLAYMATGILLGGSGLALIDNPQLTHDLAEIGILFLLFLVGLELDIGQIRRLGRIVLLTGLVQLVLVAGLGYLVAVSFGFESTPAAYLGLAAAFSSTAVVLKRLSDKQELSSLAARVTVGILLLQDLLAITALMIISASSQEGAATMVAISFALKGAGLFLGTWLITKYLLAPLFFVIARSTELLFLTSIAYAFLFALVADALGFSREIGAFLAGISLATLPYNLEIIGRVKPLRDFFLVIFFVVLGLQVSFSATLAHLPLVIVLTGLVLFVKSFLAAAVMSRAGYPKRPAYLVGAGLGQMSEFSFLLVLIGAGLGQIDSEIVGLTAALLVITITLNTYWNELNRFIYPVLAVPLTWLSGKVRSRELHYRPTVRGGHTLLFGANRMGAQMLKALEELRQDVLVVDHNPELIRRLLKRGVPSVYGDIDDYQLLREMGLAGARRVISTVPNYSANFYLIEQTRQHSEQTLIIVTAERIKDALNLYRAGADYVILPHLLGGERAAQLLTQFEDRTLKAADLRRRRKEHIAFLKRHQSDVAA